MARTEIMREYGYPAYCSVSEDYDLLVRVPGERHCIAKAQLRWLGIAVTDEELDRHYRLINLDRSCALLDRERQIALAPDAQPRGVWA